jgi:CubicO group peptidase (beta-lactamase class C family)
VRGKTDAQRMRLVLATPLRAKPGSYVQYSDLSFITLWFAAQRAAGEPLPQFLQQRVWQPLGMTSTSFWPGLGCDDCAPTQLLKSGEPYRGKPSDPIAHALGMPSGNAGLFSTARDLARFAAMIANGGELDGKRILRPDLVQLLFQQVPRAGHRSVGWEAFCPEEHLTQDTPCAHPIAYGHTGWTGTSLWIDPVRHLWVVILSNRSYNVKHPTSLEGLRADVFARALDEVDPEH